MELPLVGERKTPECLPVISRLYSKNNSPIAKDPNPLCAFDESCWNRPSTYDKYFKIFVVAKDVYFNIQKLNTV